MKYPRVNACGEAKDDIPRGVFKRTALVPLVAMSLVTVLGCSRTELADLRVKLASTEQQLTATVTEKKQLAEEQSALKRDLAAAQAAVKSAQEELTLVKQSPQYIYQRAIDFTEADSDEGDTEAIAALQAFVERHPSDSLIPAAKNKLAELDRRINERAARLKQAQSEVRSLLSRCRSLSKQANNTSNDGLRFNYFGDLDMNTAMEASRRADRLREQAQAAKTKGLELVSSVSDPGGTLKEGLEKCDEA